MTVKRKVLPDRKKVIKGLECCSSGRGAQCCYGCPYVFPSEDTTDDYDCSTAILADALALLKEAENERAGR